MEGKIEAIAIFTGIQSPYVLGKSVHGSGRTMGGSRKSIQSEDVEFI